MERANQLQGTELSPLHYCLLSIVINTALVKKKRPLTRIFSNLKNLCRDFSSTAAPSPARSIAESDYSRASTPLDSSYFDADVHLRRLIKESRLGALVEQHRALAADVGALDSDMQTLVYENYNKFIVATDIIRAMDGAMGGLDSRLQQLEVRIGGAVTRSEAVNGILEQRQGAIMELKQTREMLRQLQLVLEVPRKLKAALSQGAFEIAVDTYAEVAPVLKRHGNRKSLRKVAAEVESFRAEAAERLRGQLHSSPDTTSETIQLIARLDESTASLMDDFLGCQRRRLADALKTGEGAFLAAASSGSGIKQPLIDLNTRFLPELSRTADLFKRLFDAGSRPKLISETREWFIKYMAIIRSGLETSATASVASAAGLDISGSRRSTSSTVTNIDPSQAGFSEDWGVLELSQALDVVHSDLGRLEKSLPELSPRDKASELVGNVVRQHMTLALTAVEARFAVHMTDIRQELANTINKDDVLQARRIMQRAISELPLVAVRGLEHACRGITQWEAQKVLLEGWGEVFSTLVQAQISNVLQGVPRLCLVAAGLLPAVTPKAENTAGRELSATKRPFAAAFGAPQSDPTPQFLIALSVFCSFGHTRLADRAEELLSQQTDGAVAPGWVGDAISAASNATGKLFETCRAAIATSMANLMTSSIDETSWGNHPEARAPRPVCAKLLEALAQVDADLLAAEQEVSNNAAAVGVPHHRRHSTGSASLDSTMAGGMSFGASIGNVPWASRADVLASAVKAALHAQATALRRHMLSRAAFQQFQLDCHYLRPHLQRMVEGAASGDPVLTALDEVLVVAAERSGEPVMLEPAALDRMVTAYQTQIQAQAQQRRF